MRFRLSSRLSEREAAMRLAPERTHRRYNPGAVKARLRAAIFSTSLVLAFGASCAAQGVPPSEQWGEQHNSPGATLTYKETARQVLDGKTIVTYNLFAAGLPTGKQYVLSTVILGAAPGKVGDVYLNNEGKVVNALADPANNVAEDAAPINLVGPKGQPFQFAVASEDGRLRAFTRIIPFPIEADEAPCHLAVEEILPAYAGILIQLSGLQSNEAVVLKCNCGKKGHETKATASDKGLFIAAVATGVRGKQSGTFEFELRAQSCKIGMQIPWGNGAEKFQ